IVIIVAFLIFAAFFIQYNQNGFENITGLATSNSSDPLQISLVKNELKSGEALEGSIDIIFSDVISSSLSIEVEFADSSDQIKLIDYLNQNNISYDETEEEISASNPRGSVSLSMDGTSKKLAFMLPKFGTVDGFTMKVTGSAENPIEFPSIDVEDYTGKNEWKYFGEFVEFGSDQYPSSLNIQAEGNPATLSNNGTYYCEEVDLPESKSFNVGAKIKKNFEGSDIKAVLLSFDGGSEASGGADFCDIPEPMLAVEAGWKTCNLEFNTSKTGVYLLCIYYKGDNDYDHYDIIRDSTTSTSKYTCPIPLGSGKTNCLGDTSKDYFLKFAPGIYDGILDKSVKWAAGATDQEMTFSLTYYLSDCKENDIGDCAVPITISSANEAVLALGNLRIDYTEYGGGSAYSTNFYDVTTIPGGITKIKSTDLTNGSYSLKLDLDKFNITMPSEFNETSKVFYLEVSLIPGEKITKPVTIYGKGFVPDTGDVASIITEAKNKLSTLKAEKGDVLTIFGINLDASKLDSFESELNKIKADENLTSEESDAKLNELLDDIEEYLADYPVSFGVDTSFKDLYIPEPNDVADVSLEETEQEIYLYQNRFEVNTEVTNYILEKNDGSKDKYSLVTKTIIPKKSMSDVYVYEIIPKSFASSIDDIFFEDDSYEVLEEDPIIRYSYPSIIKAVNIRYGVKGVDVTQNMIYNLKSIMTPKDTSGEIIDEETNVCGNEICEVPYEDEVVCPEDCGGKTPIPWILIIVLIVVLTAGIVYINFYRGKGAFRKVIGKSPFKSPADLANIKRYIKASQEKNMKNPQIAKALLDTGWSKAQIIYAFEDIKWDKKRLFTISLAPKGDASVKKLKTFIKKCLELNIPEVKIKQSLAIKGWNPDKINEAFAKVGKPKEKAETVKEHQKKVKFYFESALEKIQKK
ncbi:MAG: hypothetical protein KKA79_05675, partial [Nanoarchaeota archaeon]|nr:hypothetical protein [Nanoarchaeota archaeon]